MQHFAVNNKQYLQYQLHKSFSISQTENQNQGRLSLTTNGTANFRGVIFLKINTFGQYKHFLFNLCRKYIFLVCSAPI